jgi:hypothetical protein
MTDNIDVTPGTGKTIAAENLGGALVQRVKLVLGNLDIDDGDISSSNPIPITGSITASNLSIGATGSAIPVDASFIGMSVAGNLVGLQGTANGLKVDGSAVTQPVSGTFWQTTQPVSGTFWQVTQPVSASALPLPSGASTSALQTTGNSSLSSIDGKTPALGQALAAASVPVVLTAAQLTTLTPPSTLTVTQGTGSNLHVAVDSLPALPTGTNSIGSVTVSNFPSTQAVTQSGTWNVGLSSGANTVGKVDQGVGGASAWKVDGSAVTQPVSAASLPLPSGAATAAKQPALGTAGTASSDVITIQGIASMTALKVDGSGVTQPVSAVSLPLPTGAATAAGLTTINTTLGSPFQVGGSIGNTSFASTQSGTWNITNVSGTVSLPTGASTSALQTTGNTSLSSIDGKTPALGQALMASSSPVVIASNQSAIPVSGTFFQTTQPVSIASMPSTPVTGTFYQATQPVSGTVAISSLPSLPTGANAIGSITNTSFASTQSGTWSTGRTWTLASGTDSVSAAQSGTWNIGTVSSITNPVAVTGTFYQATQPVSAASLPLPTGAATSALQTTISGQLPTSLGQKTMANSMAVVLASDQSGMATHLDKNIAGTITALAGTVALNTNGCSTAMISVTGTWVATMICEVQAGDNNWVSQSLINEITGGSNITNITSNSLFTIPVGGYTQIRIRSTAYTSGTANITINASSGDNQQLATDVNGNQQVVGNVAAGTADAGNGVKISGVYNTTLPVYTNGQRADLQLDSSGRLITNNTTITPASITGTITSTQNVAITMNSYSSVSVEITGTWTGTLIFETLVGTTWSQADVFATTTELVSGTTTVNGIFSFVNLAGVLQARVRGNTVASGTANISLNANNGLFTYPVYARSIGNPIGSYGIQMGGVDASTNTFQFQKVNTLGAAGVYLESSNKAAYSASIVPVTPPATPTDIVTLYGSATKTIRVLKLVINTTQTTIGINDWYLIKRSTANTGGTSAAITSVPLDSTFSAATAVFTRYTANPTALGTSVGNLAIVNVLSSSLAPGTSGTAYVPYVFDFTNNPIVLRGATQGIALNFNGAALPAGLSINCNIMWTEE